MYRTKSQKKNERRRANKTSRQFKAMAFTTILKYVHMLVDMLIDFLFGLYYGDGKNVSIPPVTEPFLTESAVKIATCIRTGKLTSEQVIRAHINRIKQVNPIINAVTDERFEAAIQEAQKIDQDLSAGHYSAQDLSKKPFLGVPFTTKDSTACAGMLHTFGLKSRKDKRATEDAEVVKRMKEAGGVLLAVTNIPEFNLWQETRNSVFGQTLNPYNVTRTVGGSSGGEASLLASCGSPIGIGTDIGGSIRMPAFYCGIFGHKPTSYLINTRGLTKRTGLEKHTIMCAGPMARHAEDLIPTLKVLIGPNISKLRLDDNVNVTTLNYFYACESHSPAVSAMSSEMKEIMIKTVNHFESLKDGEAVHNLELEEFRYSHRLWRYWMTQEGVDFAREITDGQGKANAFTELFKKLCGTSDYTLAAILKLFYDIMPGEKEQWAKTTTAKLKEALIEKLGYNGVLLYPSYTWPASYHHSAFLRPFNFSYWCIFNVLQLPATQVPLGLSKDGLPIGLQVVAAPYNDNLCIAVARHLQQVFGGYVPPFKTS